MREPEAIFLEIAETSKEMGRDIEELSELTDVEVNDLTPAERVGMALVGAVFAALDKTMKEFEASGLLAQVQREEAAFSIKCLFCNGKGWTLTHSCGGGIRLEDGSYDYDACHCDCAAKECEECGGTGEAIDGEGCP